MYFDRTDTLRTLPQKELYVSGNTVEAKLHYAEESKQRQEARDRLKWSFKNCVHGKLITIWFLIFICMLVNRIMAHSEHEDDEDEQLFLSVCFYKTTCLTMFLDCVPFTGRDGSS